MAQRAEFCPAHCLGSSGERHSRGEFSAGARGFEAVRGPVHRGQRVYHRGFPRAGITLAAEMPNSPKRLNRC